MDNVSFVEMKQLDGLIRTFAFIDHGNEQFTSMLKSTYDEMIAQQEENK